jgi:hypothetical protein
VPLPSLEMPSSKGWSLPELRLLRLCFPLTS